MYHKQKLHPFDFNGEDLADIKKIFPEFRPKRAVTRSSTKIIGLPIVDLKKKLKEKIQLEGKPLQKLVQKLDHRNEEKITWSEFLTFLENEGVRREIVNDAQLYGIGVKRLQEGQRIVLKEKERVTEYYIDCLCYIQMKQFRLVLALFENNAAKLMEIEDFKVIQELQFQSDYALPKEQQAQIQKNRAKTPNAYNQGSNRIMVKNSLNLMNHYDTSVTEQFPLHDQDDSDSSFDERAGTSTNHGDKSQQYLLNISQGNIYQQPASQDNSIKLFKHSKTSYSKKNINESSQKLFGLQPSYGLQNQAQNKNLTYGTQLKARQNRSISQARRSNNGNFLYQEPSITEGSPFLSDKQKSSNQQLSRNFNPINQAISSGKASALDMVAAHYKSALFEEIQEHPKNLGVQNQKGFLYNTADKRRGNYSAAKIQNNGRQSQNSMARRHLYTENTETKASTNQLNEQSIPNISVLDVKKSLISDTSMHLTVKKQARNAMSAERTNQLRVKQKKKMYGVLGLTKIEDEEGSAAYLLGKDLQRERPFGLKDLFPNLHQDYNKNKKKFEQLMVTMDKKIAANKSTIKENQAQYTIPDDDSYQVIGRIEKVKDKVGVQSEKLEGLKETNKYFYKLTSPSPYVISQQTYDKNAKKSKRGLSEREEGNRSSREDPNQCSPEMITKYVDMLNKKDGTVQKESKLKQLLGEKKEFNYETLFEQNRKNKIKHTKEIYSVCANYHQELGILAISLIDKEIKIYKLKQNGQKVTLQDQFSFPSKFIVACLHIEQYVVNSRPILCLGSNTGEVAIYYIDEPVINPLTKQKEAGRFKSLLHTQFNFFSRNNQNSTNNLNDNVGSQSRLSKRITLTNKPGYKNHDDSIDQIKAYQTEPSNNFAPSYLQPSTTENELTQIRYVREIGLIATSLNGCVKIFDGFDFKEVWKTSNKNRKQIYHTSILSFDVSTQIGLIAIGGTEGKLILIDPYAFGIINCAQAHNCEIISLYIYDEQQQIITVGADRTISVWDAYRLEKIQTLKDTSSNHTPKFTSAAFDKQHGLLFTGCQALKTWEAQVDSKIEIKALQIQTLSRTILKERKMLDQFNDDKSPQKKILAHGENKNGKVLVTNTSELVDIVISEKEDINFLVTVDSENLLRAWSVKSSSTTFSYKLPMKQSIYFQHYFRKRITAVAIDPTFQFLAVGNCIGEVQILNLKSGGILYSLPHIDCEITCLQFLQGMSEFWLVAGCWTGKLMMWTNPNEDNNFTVTAKCRIGHKDDVLAIDSSSQYIVSGGVDGLVSIWNLFSGVLKYAIALPPPSKMVQDKILAKQESLSDISDIESQDDDFNDRDSMTISHSKNKKKILLKQKSFYNEDKVILISDKTNDQSAITLKRTIVGLCFHPKQPNLICVLQEGGDIHVLDASNGTIAYEYVAKAKMNSNWACDKENQRIFVVGDIGKACMFDISFIQGPNHKMSSPSKMQAVKNLKWEMIKPWFAAHNIHQMETSFVVSVKYAAHVKVFVTATSKGEVKLWSNTSQCENLGTLNTSYWDPTGIMDVVQNARKEHKHKELKKDESKMEEIKRKSSKTLANK